MKFYEIDNALQEAITTANKNIRIKIELEVAGHFERIFEKDIVEASFFGLKEAAGGTTARGEILLDNPKGIYVGNPHPCEFPTTEFAQTGGLSQTPAKAMVTPPSMAGIGTGTQVKVSFSMGEWFAIFPAFSFLHRR